MTAQRTFKAMLEENQVITKRIQDFFQSKGYKIIDHCDDPVYQRIGVGFEIYDPKRDIFRINVVADHKIHQTGNLFIEHKMERQSKTAKGWLHTCLADIMCYCDTVNNLVYMLDWRKLREEASGFPLREFRNPYDYDTMGYGYLVPIEEAERLGLIYMKFRV